MKAHVSFSFKKLKDAPLIPFAQGVHDALTENGSQFPNLIVPLPGLLAAITDFTVKRHAAIKGSVAQTEARKAARAALLNLLNTLALQVEGVALGRAEVIRAAGFEPKEFGHTPPTPLAKPTDLRAVASTQVQLRVKAQRNVRLIKAQYRVAGGDWQDGGYFPNTKVVVVPDLVPGTRYDFRVQFIGGSTGASEWSDPLTHMAI